LLKNELSGFDFSFEDYKRCHIDVYSRAFSTGGGLMMLPMVDMFNHVTKKDADLDLGQEGGCLVMKALGDLKSGQEIFYTYGGVGVPFHMFY